MRNFYREFTKDLERRLNSRAYDIRPQTVVNNDVQMVLDIERQYFRDVTFGWRQLGISENPLTAGPQGNRYGQTPIVLTGSVVTPLTNGATAGTTTINRPTYIASNDNVYRFEIQDIKYRFSLRNPGAAPTSTTHRLRFDILKFGTVVQAQDDDVLIVNTAAIIPPGGQQVIDNVVIPQTSIRLPNIWTRDKVSTVVSPATPFVSGIDNQVTWMISHEFDPTLETEITLLDIYCSLKCRVFFETPYNSQSASPLATVVT